MKYLLFGIVYFLLPHSNWLARELAARFNVNSFGVVNAALAFACILWLQGKASLYAQRNSIKMYTAFFILVIFSSLLALIFGLESFSATATMIKRQISLMLLYYVPLACIHNEKDLSKMFLITLVINLLIGIEVLQSGVLSGMNFHDGKRGSGPFSEGLAGSDVAGAYLAQMLMFFVACIFCSAISLQARLAAFLTSWGIIFGIFATYSRGALVACAAGFFAIFVQLGLKFKYLVLAIILLATSFFFMPQSIQTRIDNTVSETGEFDLSTKGRFDYWQAAIAIVAKNPLGVGTGQVREAMRRKVQIYVDPHNGFLHTACEYGIPGLVLFSMLLISLYSTSRRLWLNHNNPPIYRLYALGMTGMVGSLVACNMFYANFYKDLVLGILALHFGMLSSIASLAADNSSKTKVDLQTQQSTTFTTSETR